MHQSSDSLECRSDYLKPSKATLVSAHRSSIAYLGSDGKQPGRLSLRVVQGKDPIPLKQKEQKIKSPPH